MNLNITHIRLECTQGGSNKFYQMTHVHGLYGKKSLLVKNWGPIGKDGKSAFFYYSTYSNQGDYALTILNKERKNYDEYSRSLDEGQSVDSAIKHLKRYNIDKHFLIEDKLLGEILLEISGEAAFVVESAKDAQEAQKAKDAFELVMQEKEAQVAAALTKRQQNPLYGSW